MTSDRGLGTITIVAGVLSFASLVVGMSGADYDFEVFTQSETFIALGAEAAGTVRWGIWLSAFGSYLLMVPLALHLHRRFRGANLELSDLSLAAAGIFILFGAAASGVLAATTPNLMEQWSATTDEGVRAALLSDFDLARRIAEDGIQGVVQNVAGAAWFLGVGKLLRRERPMLGATALVVGAAQVLNTVGILVDVEALRLLGLSVTVLVAPAWAIAMGAMCLRAGRPEAAGAQAS